MTQQATTGRQFDLQPHPRILPMLGEISLEQWRCLAELIDNSVDGFLETRRANRPLETPEVHVSIPTAESAVARIRVRDNGPGMDADTLENAMRAGWTSHGPIENLGLFGMGFNIATARIGALTRVWATRRGDSEWCGIEIDFDRLISQRHYRTPMLTRPKNDPSESGTEVTVERLKPEQNQWFAKQRNRSKVVRELGRSYSPMLRASGLPLSFRLMVNNELVSGANYCVWGGEGESRQVSLGRRGNIDAFQQIDVRLDDRLFCTKCWQWLPSRETTCSTCESADSVVTRQRRVHGWLGIQRYLSSSDYGIDFVRHGRKIELGNIDLFQWNDGESKEEEYPIDDPRHRGRIVGEVHLDHCRVTYMKDRFDRNDPAWEEMVRIVRGDGPLRPDKAREVGAGQNDSPLYLLFQAFRRSSPKPKVAGCYARLLLVPDNDRASEMAKRFHAGEPEYRSDAKWWELVQEADNALLTGPPPAGGGDGGIAGFGDGDGNGGGAGTTGTVETDGASQPETRPLARTRIASLSREYRERHTNQRWEVIAYRGPQDDPALADGSRPWALKRLPSGICEFVANTEHEVFHSATMTALDALLCDLAWSAADFARGQFDVPFSTILAGLREDYAASMKLDPIALATDAASTLTHIGRGVAARLETDDARALFEELSPAEQDAILHRMATRSVRNPQQVISDGRFLEFAPRKTQLRFFERHPELFFDGRYWDDLYEGLEYDRPAAVEEARAQLVRYYGSLLADAAWLAEQEPDDLATASRPRLLRAALALELLAPSAGEESPA